MKLTSIADVDIALKPFVDIARQTTGRGLTTERTFRLSELFGNPHERLRVVHVAGTSGKTSTAYYVAELLRLSGAKVGLTVSPHITNIAERVQINGSPLEEATFCRYMSEFLQKIDDSEFGTPSYFEIMMVFALWVFDKEAVDYVVVETGLGGLHDSSNICRREDKICVITDIGIDHTHVLGDNIESIAWQKAGIVAPGNYVIMHSQSQAVAGVVAEEVKKQHATLEVLPLAQYDNYQSRNFDLARATYLHIAKRDGLAELTEQQMSIARSVQVPGRFQVKQYGGSLVILDGAHNEQKMQAFVQMLQSKYPDKKWAVVFAMKSSKDYGKVISIIAPFISKAIAVPLGISQDTPIKSVDPQLLANEFAYYGVDCEVAVSTKLALNSFLDAGEPNILVTGSLYVVSEVSLES